MSRRHLLSTIFVVLSVAIIVLIVTLNVPESKIRQNLNLFPNSQLIFEDSAAYGGGTRQKSVYFWTDAPLSTVQAHYEHLLGTFISSEDQGRSWMMNAFHVNNSPLNITTSSVFLTHESFCPNSRDYGCVSVALINPDQSELYTVPILSPSGFRRTSIPVSLQSLMSKGGTLIIYGYWIEDY